MPKRESSKPDVDESTGEVVSIKRNQEIKPPPGFEPVSAARGVPWYDPETLEVVSGELVGRFTRRDSERAYYHVRVDTPCTGYQKPEGGKRGDREEVQVDVGQLISVDERTALEDLAPLAKDETKRYQVWIKAKEKVDIGGGKTFWSFDIFKRVIISKR